MGKLISSVAKYKESLQVIQGFKDSKSKYVKRKRNEDGGGGGDDCRKSKRLAALNNRDSLLVSPVEGTSSNNNNNKEKKKPEDKKVKMETDLQQDDNYAMYVEEIKGEVTSPCSNVAEKVGDKRKRCDVMSSDWVSNADEMYDACSKRRVTTVHQTGLHPKIEDSSSPALETKKEICELPSIFRCNQIGSSRSLEPETKKEVLELPPIVRCPRNGNSTSFGAKNKEVREFPPIVRCPKSTKMSETCIQKDGAVQHIHPGEGSEGLNERKDVLDQQPIFPAKTDNKVPSEVKETGRCPRPRVCEGVTQECCVDLEPARMKDQPVMSDQQELEKEMKGIPRSQHCSDRNEDAKSPVEGSTSNKDKKKPADEKVKMETDLQQESNHAMCVEEIKGEVTPPCSDSQEVCELPSIVRCTQNGNSRSLQPETKKEVCDLPPIVRCTQIGNSSSVELNKKVARRSVKATYSKRKQNLLAIKSKRWSQFREASCRIKKETTVKLMKEHSNKWCTLKPKSDRLN